MKVIIGVVLIIIGITGLLGIPSSDNVSSLIIGSLFSLLIGIFLLSYKNTIYNEVNNTSVSQTSVINKNYIPYDFYSIPHINPLPKFIQNILDENGYLHPIQIKDYILKIDDCRRLDRKSVV